MNELVFKSEKGNPVTTSKLVAEKFDKRHADVIRAIEDIMSQLPEIEHKRIFALVYENIKIGNGAERKSPIYMLTRDGFSLLVMGFTGDKALKFKLEFIEAFNKMEQIIKSNTPSIPKSFAEALQLAADQARQLELQAPKVEMYQLVMDADNNLALNEAAKTIGIGRNKMTASLRERKIFRANNTPYQRFISEGYFVVKVRPIVKGDTTENYSQAFVTPKGLEYLSKLFK